MIFSGFDRLLHRFAIWQDNNRRSIFKDQTGSEQFYLHQKLGSLSRGVENASQSLCVGRGSAHGLTYCNMRQEAREDILLFVHQAE